MYFFSIQDHASGVNCIDFDSKRFVTGGNDGLIYVYDLKEAAKLGKLEGFFSFKFLQIFSNKNKIYNSF